MVGDIIALNSPQEKAAYPRASGIVKQLTRNVTADSACSACYAALVRGLYVAKEAGVKNDQKISIGQGFRGREIEGIGVGNCCIGADHCVKGCPPTAADVERVLRDLTC